MVEPSLMSEDAWKRASHDRSKLMLKAVRSGVGTTETPGSQRGIARGGGVQKIHPPRTRKLKPYSCDASAKNVYRSCHCLKIHNHQQNWRVVFLREILGDSEGGTGAGRGHTPASARPAKTHCHVPTTHHSPPCIQGITPRQHNTPSLSDTLVTFWPQHPPVHPETANLDNKANHPCHQALCKIMRRRVRSHAKMCGHLAMHT